MEIELTPVELGRVTVLLGSEDQAGRIGLIVERPETLDLIRRHTDQLLRDLKEGGMPDAQMGFLRQEGGGRQQAHGTSLDWPVRTREPEALSGPTAGESLPQAAPMNGRLDVRL